MVSFGNAGVTLGTFLGGLIITRFGVHEVIWISIGLLVVALALTWVFVGQKPVTMPVETVEREAAIRTLEADLVEEAMFV
jgi:hypothetical protein